MNYKLSDGNVIVADAEFIAEHYPDAVLVVEPEPEVFIPQVVTMRQARLALLDIGIYESHVNTAIEELEEPNRSIARIEWNHSSEVHRDKAFVSMLGGILGLGDDDIDQLFITAAGIE